MERLTLKGYEYDNSNFMGYGVSDMANKLREYEDLEEQGLLLRLPCKVGSTVYVLFKLTNSGEWIVSPYEHRITDIFLNEKKEPLFKITNAYGTFKLSEFGKTVFLTREEAEQALAEMQKG